MPSCVADHFKSTLKEHGICVVAVGTTAGKRHREHTNGGCSWVLITDCHDRMRLEDTLLEESVRCEVLTDREEGDRANAEEIQRVGDFVTRKIPNMASAFERWKESQRLGIC